MAEVYRHELKLIPTITLDVVDGVPQCPHCDDPMVRRCGGWVCPVVAPLMDGPLARLSELLDAQLGLLLVSPSDPPNVGKPPTATDAE